MRRIQFIPLGQLAPDAQAVDSGELRRTIGLLPLHGKYRSMPLLAERTSKETPYPINGSHPHLITPTRSKQNAQPIADEVPQIWQSYGDDDKAPEDADPTQNWWRLVAPIDELVGVYLAGGNTATISAWSLPDLEDPNSTTGHFIRFRYRIVHNADMNSWDLQLNLVTTTGPVASITLNQAGHSGERNWITAEHELTPAEVGAITNYTGMTLQIIGASGLTGSGPIAIPLVAVVGETPAEWDQEPSDSELTKVQMLEDGDVATYLTQTGVGGKGFEALLYDITPPDNPAAPGTNWSMFAQVGSPNVALNVTLKMLEAGSVVSESTIPVAQGPITAISYTIPEADLIPVEDWNSISVRLDAVSQTAGAAITLRPDKPKTDGNWSPVGQPTLWEATSDQNNNTYAVNVINPLGDTFRVGLPTPTTAPSDGEQVTVKIRTTKALGNVVRVDLKFGSGSTQHFQKTKILQTGNNNVYEATGSPSGVDWSDAWVEVELRPENQGVNQELQVKEIWVESTEPSSEFEVQVAEVGLRSPTEQPRLEVTFMEYDLPISKPLTPGDRVQIYAGNERSIYEVGESTGFQDVSKTADASYGQLSGSLTGWRFASWGNKVIATNGSDPIQYQEEQGERFVDLLDTGVEPDTEVFTARFIAVARDFLFTANCLHPSLAEVSEYVLWWSAINNPRLFKQIDLTTLSDYQPLVTTAGAITGLIGGEFITAYKRSSIYRGTFVGPPLIWDMQLVSYLEGTMYPESIVAIDRDQFFFGNGGFRHLPFGSGVRPIGDGKITKMFTDKLYEDRALRQFDSQDLREIENSLVGTYDHWSRQIVWLYRGRMDNLYQNRMAIVYNPWEDRWSILDLPFTGDPLPIEIQNRAGYTDVMGLPTIPSDEDTYTRNLTTFGFDRSRITYHRSVSDKSYPIEVKSHILSSGAIAGAPGKLIHIHGIRPISSVEEAIDDVNYRSPKIVATVVGARDSLMSCEMQQRTVASRTDNEDDNGWLMFDEPLPGEYFTIELEYDEVEDELLREIVGWQLDSDVGGSS